MIFPLSGMFLGGLIGAFSAKRRGGKALDLLQWAGVLGIIGALIGLFVLVFIERAVMLG